MTVKLHSLYGQTFSKEIKNKVKGSFNKLYKDLKFNRGEYTITTSEIVRTTPYPDDFVIFTILKNGKEFFPLKVDGMEGMK